MGKCGLALVPFLAILLIVPISGAHIPELVLEGRNYTVEPFVVKEPEISYAYYGKLQGSPHVYRIESDRPFHLYVSLLVPYTGEEESSSVEFHIMKGGEKIVMMHGYENWTKWYEEYGGDWYLQGPEYEADVEAGVYLVEVHSGTNSEDYVVAIGNKERFGPIEILQTVLVLPLMKALFWDSYTMVGAYVLILVLIVILVFVVRRRPGERKKRGKRKRA